MPFCVLIEYGDSYTKTPGSLLQYYRDEPFTNGNGVMIDVPDDSASFKYKQKIAGQTGNDRTKNVQIMVQLKY